MRSVARSRRAMNQTGKTFRPLNVVLAPGSIAEKKFRRRAAVPQIEGLYNEALVPGIHAAPEHNLIFHGGKTIPHLLFTNFYIGGEHSWDNADIKSIDAALAASMSDKDLNNVMRQYFEEDISSDFHGSKILPGRKPRNFSQGDLENMLTGLYKEKSLND